MAEVPVEDCFSELLDSFFEMDTYPATSIPTKDSLKAKADNGDKVGIEKPKTEDNS